MNILNYENKIMFSNSNMRELLFEDAEKFILKYGGEIIKDVDRYHRRGDHPYIIVRSENKLYNPPRVIESKLYNGKSMMYLCAEKCSYITEAEKSPNFEDSSAHTISSYDEVPIYMVIDKEYSHIDGKINKEFVKNAKEYLINEFVFSSDLTILPPAEIKKSNTFGDDAGLVLAFCIDNTYGRTVSGFRKKIRELKKVCNPEPEGCKVYTR